MLRWILAVALALAVSGAQAEDAKKVSVGLWGGWTTVGMGDVNDLVDSGEEAYKAGVESMGGDPDKVKATKVTSGFAFGLEGTYAVAAGLGAPGDSLGVGLRAGMLMPGTAEVSYEEGDVKVSQKIESSAIPVELGVRYSYPVSGQVTIDGGLFAGLGMVSVTDKYDAEGIGDDVSVSDTYSASVLALEVLVGAGYKVTPEFTLGLDLGYRLLNAPKVKATADNEDTGVEKGDALTTINDDGEEEDVKIDMSGLLVALRAAFSF